MFLPKNILETLYSGSDWLVSHFLCMKMFLLCLPDDSLRVCVQAGPGCCTSKMEDSYMAAVRSETQQKMRSYSFELKYLIAGHSKAYQGEGEKRRKGTSWYFLALPGISWVSSCFLCISGNWLFMEHSCS